MYQLNNQNQYWRSTYGAYISGPLIKDRLFVYASAEMQKREGTSVRSTQSDPAGYNQYACKLPRWIAKVDWNITDNHIVEFTGVSDKTEYDAKYTGFNYDDFSHDNDQSGGIHTKDGGELYIGKYAGYLTDNLTVTGQYGRQKIDHLNQPWNFDPTCPRISGWSTPANQMPGIVYNAPCQTAASSPLPGANDKVKATYRDLRSAIDDICAPALGGRCFTFNPGVTNTFAYEQDDGSFEYVTPTTEQLGFPKLKRKYVAVELFAEHMLNNSWYGKLEYTWSRNFGSTEGQLLSGIDTGTGGQSDVSQTQDWDLPQIMHGAGGRLANDRTHQDQGLRHITS